MTSAIQQETVIEDLLNAYPSKQRIIFVHIPKCGGTDLSGHIGKRYPADLHYTMTNRKWYPPERLQQKVDQFIAAAPEADAILVHGHIRLRWVMNHGIARQGDRLFTIVREPRAILLSQLKYITSRLLRDPGGDAVDTAGWLRAIGVNHVIGQSMDEVAELALSIVHRNPIATLLGDCTAASAIAAIRKSNIEIADLSRYPDWAAYRWGERFNTRHNASEPIELALTEEAIVQNCGEDVKLYRQIMVAMKNEICINGSALSTGAAT